MYRAASLVLLLLWGGCLADVPGPSDAEVVAVPDSSGLPISIRTTATGKDYGLSLTNLTYENSLNEFVIFADGPLNVSVHLKSRFGAYGAKPACAAGAVSLLGAADGERPEANLYAVHWAWQNDARAVANAMGQDVTVVPSVWGDSGGTASEVDVNTTWNLSAGQRIIVQLGGSDPAFAHGSSESLPNAMDVLLAVNGSAHVERGTERTMRCGVSTHGLDPGMASVDGLASVEVGGAAAIETLHASSLIFAKAFSWVGATEKARLTFLNETIVPSRGLVVRTSPEAGTVEVAFELWAAPLPTDPAWFLADVYWPALLATTTQS